MADPTVENNTSPVENNLSPVENNPAPVENHPATAENNAARVENNPATVENNTSPVENNGKGKLFDMKDEDHAKFDEHTHVDKDFFTETTDEKKIKVVQEISGIATVHESDSVTSMNVEVMLLEPLPVTIKLESDEPKLDKIEKQKGDVDKDDEDEEGTASARKSMVRISIKDSRKGSRSDSYLRQGAPSRKSLAIAEGSPNSDAIQEALALAEKASKRLGSMTAPQRLKVSQLANEADFRRTTRTSQSLQHSREILELQDIATVRRSIRPSTVSEKPSFTDARELDYALPPRLQGSIGDDLRAFMFDDEKQVVSFDFNEVEEAEEESVSEEEEPETLDREPYYEKYEMFQSQISIGLLKSYILQKKLSIYFKKRNLQNAIREDDKPLETSGKYNSRLEDYGSEIEFSENQKHTKAAEIQAFRVQRAYRKIELEQLLNNLQNREMEIAKGLINSKTGTEIPEKLTERYIKRQRLGMGQLSAMTLKFIRLKDMVHEKLTDIAAIDEVEPGLYLGDYEQLKSINRGNTDKIEEKEETLTRLRGKIENTVQVLAHLREKTVAFDSDLLDLRDNLNEINSQSFEAREHLNEVKMTRDVFRHKTDIIRRESGILTHPSLLRDMQESLAEIQRLHTEVDQLKESHCITSKMVCNLRKHIEEFQSVNTMKRLKNMRASPIQKIKTINYPVKVPLPSQKIFRVKRPTLQAPIIQF